MLEVRPYNRLNVQEYALRWALERNPLFYDFEEIGGDCTNFASQCALAGCCQMNYQPMYGWYFISTSQRAPAWTGVSYFYNFITRNQGAGPFGREVAAGELDLGDFIQLGDSEGVFYHTLVITGFEKNDYLVSAHSNDARNRRLSSYTYARARFIHVEGYRGQTQMSACFENLIRGERLPNT